MIRLFLIVVGYGVLLIGYFALIISVSFHAVVAMAPAWGVRHTRYPVGNLPGVNLTSPQVGIESGSRRSIF